jgi:hypothetical protein
METLDQVARRYQYRNISLDARDGDRIALGQLIAFAQQQAAEHSRWRGPAEPLASGAFGASAPRGPFGDDTQAASEASCRLTPPPQLGAVAVAGRPFGIEPGEMRLKNVRPRAKHVTTAAAHDVTHQLAAATGTANDLLDRRTLLGQGSDDAMGLFPPQITFVLQALGMG